MDTYLEKLLQSSETIEVGNTVLILYPEYVAGRIGLVCGQENINREALPKLLPRRLARWLIQVDSENMVISLTADEFQIISQNI